MRLRPDQLYKRLERGDLAPVYLVTGDEPLQAMEAADAIRAAARAAGAGERVVLDVDTGFDWGQLAAHSDNLSLFSRRRLIDLRLGEAKPGKDGGAALAAYAGEPPGEDVLLVTAGKLDRRQQATAWFKAVEGAGAVVTVRAPDAGELPEWLRGRAATRGLRLSGAAAELIADRVEGNLLAAVQALEKLHLVAGGETVDAEAALSGVGDSARYDVFALADAMLAGEAGRALRMLGALRASGVEPAAIGWVLAREMLTLAALSAQVAAGSSEGEAMGRLKVWRNRQPLFRAALHRLRPARLARVLRQAMRLDRTIKGATGGDPWQEMTWLCLTAAGVRVDTVTRTLLT